MAVGRRQEPLDALLEEFGPERIAPLSLDITGAEAPGRAVAAALGQ